MRGSFGARHLAALCAHRMGALCQVARPDREQRRRPSVTGEIPRSDLVLRQQAARPRRGGVAQELGQRRVYYADPDIDDRCIRRRHAALRVRAAATNLRQTVYVGRPRPMPHYVHYGAWSLWRWLLQGAAYLLWAPRLLRRWRDTRRLVILAALDSRSNVLTSGHRIAMRSDSADALVARMRLGLGTGCRPPDDCGR